MIESDYVFMKPLPLPDAQSQASRPYCRAFACAHAYEYAAGTCSGQLQCFQPRARWLQFGAGPSCKQNTHSRAVQAWGRACRQGSSSLVPSTACQGLGSEAAVPGQPWAASLPLLLSHAHLPACRLPTRPGATLSTTSTPRPFPRQVPRLFALFCTALPEPCPSGAPLALRAQRIAAGNTRRRGTRRCLNQSCVFPWRASGHV